MRKFLTTLQVLTAGVLLTAMAAAQNTPSPQSAPAANSGAAAQSQAAPPAASANIPGLPTQKDKISYAIGLNVGKGLHRESIDVDPKLVMKGLEDALADGKTLMTDDQVQATIVELQAQVRQREDDKRRQLAVTNAKAGETFLAANKTKPGVVTLPSGLQYKIVKEGSGPKPTLNDVVTCNYKGTLLDGKEFDSTEKHGEPAKLPVRGVIKAWTEALQLMPVGSKWQLYVPPDLAYGEHGAGNDIGPNETLIFDVELLSIMEQKPAQPGQAPGQQPGNPNPGQN